MSALRPPSIIHQKCTDNQAESARQKLAEYEAAKAAQARAEENDRRATARAAFKPLADIGPDLKATGEQLQAVLDGGIGAERGLADLARNVCVTIEGLRARLERRVADTEPVPEPEPGPAQPTPPSDAGG